MSERLQALAASLKQPLLVTDLVNIAYLTGFDSSNAALLVRPGGEAALYTDFRYIDSAREVPDVEATLTRRSLLVELADLLKGTVQFEAAALPYNQWQNLSAGKAKLVPTTGIVERLRAVKDGEELAAIRRAARIADRAFEALTAETWIGRSERELAWRMRE
ncbi:MAG: aminopeptidase P family N-terminal domain-containing protein, partial [Caldimonas sp.]